MALVDAVYGPVLHEVQNLLSSWDFWGKISKSGAIFLGVLVTTGGVLISSKQLPNRLHYAVSALVAGSVFAYGLLQPYEEYKQFRKAYYTLDTARLTFVSSDRTRADLDKLLDALREARGALEEKWAAPAPAQPSSH